MKRIWTFLKKKDLYLGIARYFLGGIMLLYAITKIFKTQFIVLPTGVWQQPLESLNGAMLAWAFYAHTPWFQRLLGYLELIPAILLFFRRTTLLGAVLLLPVSLNILLVNYAFNLWDDTKQTAVLVLALNCLVLIFEWKLIGRILSILVNINRRRLQFSIVEMVLNTLLIGIALYLFSAEVLKYKNRKSILEGNWMEAHPNEWVLQTETIKDSLLPHRLLKSYFMVQGSYNEINDTGFIHGKFAHYELDEKKHQLTLQYDSNSTALIHSYRLIGDSLLQMERVIDSAKDVRLTQVFRKRIVNAGK